MDSMKSLFALTGDAETDEVCPSHPRLLAEVAVVAIDGARLMLVGGLAAPIVGRNIGALDVLVFLRQLDGTRTLEHLCADQLPAMHERKRLLYLLLRHGLLEQPAPSAAPAVHPETASFLAKMMDQTRIHNRRPDVVAAFLRPVGMLGAGQFCLELTLALKQCGLNVIECTPAAPVCQMTIAVLDGATPLDAQVDRLQEHNASVLLICPRGLALDVGPLLTNRGCCTTACYRASCGDGYGFEPASQSIWLALLCNAVVLLNSGTAPLSLVNNFIRYQLSSGQIRTSSHPVPRRHALGAKPGALAAPDGPEQLERIERHSRVAVPPRRLIGVKSYDQHYAPKNIAAAKQFPLPHGDARKVISLANATPQQRLLLQLIIRTFGYWDDTDGNPRRICPSGGNLGAAECVVVWHDQVLQQMRLMRYVPVVDWLEPVADAPIANAAGVPEYEIICLCNIEKARQKYSDFGLSLGFLDGGVGAAFLHAAALAAGQTLTLDYEPIPQDWVRNIVDQRCHYYRFAWRAGLPSITAEPAQWEQYDRLLRQRRAARDCTRLDLTVGEIAALLQQARPQPRDGAAAALLSCLRLVLAIEQAGTCVSYEWVSGSGLRLCAGSTIARDGPNQELLSQRNLSRAAGRLFMLADLPLVLNTQGAGGHDRLLTLIGHWIGSFWLAIERLQLRGCPAGATIESDLLNHLPPAYAHLFNLFAFTFGNAEDATPCNP